MLLNANIAFEICIAFIETIYMVLASGFLAVVLGLPVGTLLFMTRHLQCCGSSSLHRILGILVNITRSIPFIILMVACIPITRWIVGTSIGTTAAIVPLTLAAIPFVARLLYNVFSDVPYGLIETGLSMGATNCQIIRHVLLVEALPGIIQAINMTLINLIAYSAMAGTIGGGGLGDLAIRYGYQRFNITVMLITTIILVLLVQGTQQAGDWLEKKVHR